MTRPIPMQLEGFTPIIDRLVEEKGLVTAAVYGVVSRYCQMSNQVCTASLDKIAGRLGLSYSTVLRHIKVLCKLGYLEDRSEGVRNRPHIYADTGKLSVQGTIKAGLSENPPAPEGLSERQSGLSEKQTRSVRKTDEETLQETSKRQEKNTTLPAEETPSAPKPHPIKDLLTACEEAWGYPVEHAKKEAAAAKALLKRHTQAEIVACVRYLQTDPWWADKHVGLQSIRERIGPWKLLGMPTTSTNGGGNGRSKVNRARRRGVSADEGRDQWTRAAHGEYGHLVTMPEA